MAVEPALPDPPCIRCKGLKKVREGGYDVTGEAWIDCPRCAGTGQEPAKTRHDQLLDRRKDDLAIARNTLDMLARGGVNETARIGYALTAIAHLLSAEQIERGF